MTATHVDSVRHLEAEFAEAMTRMYAVGNGLAALRQRLLVEDGVVAAPAVVAVPRGEAATGPGTTAAARAADPELHGPERDRPGSPAFAGAPGASQHLTTPPPSATSAGHWPPAAPGGPAVPPPAIAEPREPWWQREGMIVRLLGAAGAGVLLIGVVLLLAFAIQHGYLGPVARVGGAGALAGALIGAAHRLHRDPKRAAGATAVAAAGYATAYLDIIAATVIYDWLAPSAGLALAGAVAAGGILQARAWDQEFLALITVGGVAALGPVLGDGATLLTAAFLVVLSIAAYPAHIGKEWVLLHLARVLPAAAALGVASQLADRRPVLGLALLFAGFELGACFLAVRVGPARPGPSLLYPLLAASAVPLALVADATTAPAWAILALAAAAYLGAAVAAGPETDGRHALRFAPWAGGVGTGLAALAVVDGLHDTSPALGLAALALAYAAAARALDRRWVGWAAAGTLALGLVASAPVFGALISQYDAVRTLGWADAVGAALLAAASLLALPTIRTLATRLAGRPTRIGEIVCLAIALATASAAVVGVAVVAGEGMGRPAGGFVVGHGLATLLWAAGAAYLLMHGLRRGKDATLALRTGLLLAGGAVAKLLLFDLATLDGLVRIVAFIGAGLALLAMGTGYARTLDRVRAAG